MKFLKRASNTATVALLTLLPLAGAAQAQNADYPNRIVRVVVPFAPGGSTDNAGRMVALSFEKQFKQTFVVENKPGAFTQIGTDAVVKAAPNGYTLLLAASNLPTEQVINKDWPFKAERDLTTIGLISGAGLALAVNPASPIKNLRDLIDFSKANPGKLNQAMAASPALDIEDLKARLGLNLTAVIYKGGPLAVQAVVSGEGDITSGSPQDIVSLVRAGRLRALVYSEKERHPLLPDVPTVNEAGVGISDFDGVLWFGLFGPAGLPADIVTKLHGGVQTMLKDPEMVERIRSLGMRPFPLTLAEARARVAAETARTEALMARGVKLR